MAGSHKFLTHFLGRRGKVDDFVHVCNLRLLERAFLSVDHLLLFANLPHFILETKFGLTWARMPCEVLVVFVADSVDVAVASL